jgi:PPOX class probable F420-dependent enzyme
VPNPSVVQLSDRVRAFLEQPHFATLGTVGPEGAPNLAVIWYRLEADSRILVNSLEGRRWPANLKRDPRVSLAVILGADPNRWVGITGHVEQVVDDVDQARDDIVALARRYGDDTPATIASFRKQQRVSFQIRIERYHDHLEDD